jgi:hypothetical protein
VSRSTLFGSPCPPNESGNTAPCDSGSRALRSRKIATSQSDPSKEGFFFTPHNPKAIRPVSLSNSKT